MNRFDRSADPEINRSQREVITSLERSGLDRRTTLVLGGSALVLAGIRPANDVDVMVPGTDFQTYLMTGLSPSGMQLRLKPGAKRPFLETHPPLQHSAPLSLDITHPHDEKYHRGSVELDREYLRQIAQFPKADGYTYLPPELVAAHKAGIGRRKDRQDLKLIRSYLQNQR